MNTDAKTLCPQISQIHADESGNQFCGYLRNLRMPLLYLCPSVAKNLFQ
jgi:hypothetical protein